MAQVLNLRNYFKTHSDSTMDDGIATAAWKNLPTARLPAWRQDWVEGSQLKISVSGVVSGGDTIAE